MPQHPSTNDYRSTIGLFATGVTVLTVYTSQEDWIGMTANAITSVSLEPLLLLVCVEKTADMAEALLNAPGFAVNILNSTQVDLSNYFANMWDNDQPPHFTTHKWSGGPRLGECLGAIACKTHEIVEGGDHWIIMGEVVDLYRSDNTGNPLLFFGGNYHTLNT